MTQPEMPDFLAAITDLIGSVDGLEPDLSANKKEYLAKWDYGRNTPRPRTTPHDRDGRDKPGHDGKG